MKPKLQFGISLRIPGDPSKPSVGVSFTKSEDLWLSNYHHSIHGLIVKYPSTYASRLGMKRKDDWPVCQFYLSDGRPGLGLPGWGERQSGGISLPTTACEKLEFSSS